MSIENIPSNAWDEILEKAKAETKTTIKYLTNLSPEENQGVFIHKLAYQKLGVYFQGRFIELLQTVDDTAVDLRVGDGVDFETSECVGELKAQRNTDNSSSKPSNIQKLRVASQGTKQMIYGYMRSKINKIKDGIHYLGGENQEWITSFQKSALNGLSNFRLVVTSVSINKRVKKSFYYYFIGIGSGEFSFTSYFDSIELPKKFDGGLTYLKLEILIPYKDFDLTFLYNTSSKNQLFQVGLVKGF